MGDRINPIKFGPEWLRNLASEPSSSGNPTVPSSSANQGPAVSPNRPNTSTSNAAQGVNTVSASAAPATTSTSTQGQLTSKVLLARLRYGREEMLALYDRDTAEAPEQLKVIDVLYQSRGKPPYALNNTFEDESNETPRNVPSIGSMASGDRYNMPRGRGAPMADGRGRALSAGDNRTSRTRGFLRTTSLGRGGGWHTGGQRNTYSGVPDDDPNQSSRSWNNSSASSSSVRTNSEQQEWNRNKRQNNTNWRQQHNNRDGWEEWRSQNSWGPEKRGQEKWEWDTYSKDKTWNNNRRTWVGGDSNEDALPEWAVENAEACGGTFDSSGAFHGYSNDDTNLPKPQESSHPLTRSHTHGAFARSKTADEGSEEWWASEKAKKLSPKKGYVQLDIHQIQYRKRVSKETPSSKVATSSANTAGVNSTAAINESAIDNASPPADPKDGKSSMEHDKANNKDGVDTQDLAPEPDKKDNIDKEKQDKKIFQTKYPDNNQRQENNTEESHDDKGNLKSVMIPSNNILRQKHQNIGTPTETPTRQQATPNLLQLLEIEKSNQNNKNYDNDVDAQKESETNKLVDDILEMNLEDDLTSLTNKGLPLRIKQSHLSKAIGMGSQNPNAPASTIQPKGMQSNIIQPIGITNNMLNATLGLPIGPSPNLGLPMQGMKQQSMSSSGIANPGMLGGLQGLGGNLQSLNRHPSVLQGGIQAGMPGAMQSAIQGGMQSNIQGGMQSGAHGGMQGSAHGIMQGGAHAGMQSGAHGGMQSGAHGGMQSGAHGGMQSGAHGGMQSGAHGGMQSGAHGGMQSGAHGGMQSGAHGGMQSGAHGGMLSGAHGGMQGGIQGGMASGMQQGGMPSGMQGSMQSGMQGSMQSGMQGNMQSGMQGNLQGNMQSAMQGNMQSAMQGNMQSAMQGNMQSGMQGNMQSAMQGNMQSGMQGGMQSSMQGGMQSSMQVSGLQGGIQNNNMSQQHNHGMQPGGPGFPSGSGAIPGIVTSTVGNNSLFLNQGPNNPMQGSNDISNHGNQQNMFGMHGLQSSASQSAFNSSIYNNLMSNQGGNTMPPIPNMAHFLTLCDQWYYEDPENIIRGPFSSKEMFIWSQAGFFPEMLLVRRACDNGMRPLGVYGLTPFSQIDILPPLGFDRRNQENLLTPQPGLGIDVTNQMVPKNMNNNKLLIMPNNPKTHRNDGGMSNPPQFRAPGPRSPRVGQPRQQMVESLWGQPSQDMLWMQPGNSSRADNRMNNMPLFYWSRQSSAISSNALLPEEITKEMKTEDQILAQLRAQNPPVSQSLSFLGDDAMKKLDDPPFTPSAATTSNLEALEKLIQKDTSRNVNAGVDPIGEQKCDKGKLDLSLEKQLQSKILDNKVIKPVAKPDNDKTIKNKDNGNGKGKGKKTKDDKKDENEVKKEDEMKAEKRSQEPSPSKNKKDEKTSKKDMEKEKKEWIKEGFTIVKGSDKNKDKKKTEEMKAAEEMERKRKEEERIIAIEDEKRRRQQMEVFKRQQEIQQQQSRQSVEMSIKKAPWCTVGNPVSHPTGREAGLSLAEIQRLEREKKLEQMKEQQHMMHILAQQQAAALAREQDVQIGLGWAKKMSSSAAGQSLAEIQAETRKQAAAGAAAVAAAVREEVQPPQPPPIISTPWATTPNGGAHAPNNPIGFWDSTPQNQLAKAEKIPEPPKPVEPPKPAKKKVTVVVPPKKENTHWAEFDAWCTSSLSAWQEANIDVPTFIAFLKDIESPYEVKDYVKVYLGDTKESSEFARQFLERRSRMLRVGMVTPSDDLCSPAIAVNPRTNSGSDYQEVKGKGKKTKKNKMLKVDARILGFSVTASEDRINVGDIDTV